MSDGPQVRIFSLLVENKPGVLFRIASHFRRRSFNIESVAVGPTENRDIARMVITMVADEDTAASFARLLKKTVDVIDLVRMDRDQAIMSELVQIKMRTDDLPSRNSVLAMVGAWGGKVLEITKGSVCVEITGSPSEIDNYVDMAAEFGILGVSRTGVTALAKG
jgi:acetolactate synthase-1/3 small subunit